MIVASVLPSVSILSDSRREAKCRRRRWSSWATDRRLVCRHAGDRLGSRRSVDLQAEAGLEIMPRENLKIQFVSDALVDQVVDGQKTASVVALDEVDVAEDEYNDALVVGRYYDVYDSTRTRRATIRIVAMELCRWNAIPDRLWRGEANASADEFRSDHVEYFGHPEPDFEFVAYYFEVTSARSAARRPSGTSEPFVPGS